VDYTRSKREKEGMIGGETAHKSVWSEKTTLAGKRKSKRSRYRWKGGKEQQGERGEAKMNINPNVNGNFHTGGSLLTLGRKVRPD